jgi:hypothetical protein
MLHQFIRYLLDLITTLTITFGSSQAVIPQEDVQRVVNFIMQPDAYKHLVLKRPEEDGGLTVVFVENGKRYTFFYSPPTFNGKIEESGGLSVWIISNDPAKRKTDLNPAFSDDDLDGTVNFGVQCSPGAREDERRYFNLEKSGDGDVRGLQFSLYWQGLYNTAIQDAIHHFNRK